MAPNRWPSNSICKGQLCIPRGSIMCTCPKCVSRREAFEAAKSVALFAPRYVPTYKTPLIPDDAPDHAVRVDLERHAGYHQEQP